MPADTENLKTIPKDCFVIAPIGEENSDIRRRSDQILRHIIKPAAEICGYKATRADEIDTPGLITSQVIQRVIGDPMVIADLTGTNPNVFYELAIRHASRRPLVQLIEKGERIPFDLAGTRTVSVDHRDLDSVDRAKTEIVTQIRALEKNPELMETPISLSYDLEISKRPQPASMKPDLEQLARSGDPQAMIELSLSASPRAFDVLSSVLRISSEEKTRVAAVHAIANLADDRKIPLLGEILVTEKWSVAAACAQALGRSRSKASIPYLIKALRLKVDWVVAQKSAEALGFLEPTEQALRTLVRSLNDEGHFEAEAAKQSLVTHGNVSVPALLDNLSRTVSYNGLLLTIQALEAIGDERAIPGLGRIHRRIDEMTFEDRWKEKLKTAVSDAIETIKGEGRQ
jgi:HEAT repeat protein